MSGSVKPPTAQQAVLAELRGLLTAGELRPGEQIRQDALAETLGVSRVPLREALKILEGEGQVTYAAHRGYFVAELSLTDLLEVYRIRGLLEPEAVRTALPRLTDEDVTRVLDAHDDVERASAAGDLAAMTAANRRFHFALMDPCGLPRLIRFVRLLWDATDAYRSLYYNLGEHRAAVVHEHGRAVAAMRAADGDALVKVLDEHRENAVAALRALLPADPV